MSTPTCKPCGHAEDAQLPNCQVCLLFATNYKYRALWKATAGVAVPDEPCPYEGTILEYATCGDPNKHVRDCDVHGRCTRGISRIQSCTGCPDRPTVPQRELVEFCNFAAGIGDTVSALYAACGLADAGHPVAYHVKNSDWLTGVVHPNVSFVPYRRDRAPKLDCGDQHGPELRAAAAGTSASRSTWYCRRLREQRPALPAFAPARPKVVVSPPPVIDPGYVLIAPFSSSRGRDWSDAGWRRLHQILTEAGKKCVYVGSMAQKDRLAELTRRLPGAKWFYGHPPAWVVSLVAHAEHVVGNDSGIPHIAGLHSVPATAVTSHLKGSYLFAESPTVRSVMPSASKWKCSPCGWDAGRGFNRNCRTLCPAIHDVSAEAVAASVLSQDELDAGLGARVERLIPLTVKRVPEVTHQ